MPDTGKAEPAPAGKRFAIDRSVAGFQPTSDASALGRASFDQVYSFCKSATIGEQCPLFRSDQLPQDIVSEHFAHPDPPEINVYAAPGRTLGGAGLFLNEDRIWLPPDCYPGYLGAMCEQSGGALPDIWAGALNTTDPAIVRHNLVLASPLHPNLVYGHFLIEMLPKLYLLRAIRDMGVEFKVALRRTTQSWAKAFIDLYFSEHDLIWYDHRTEVLLPDAVLSPGMMHRDYNFHPLMNVALEDVRLRAKAATPPAGQTLDTPALVYLSRTRVPGAWHRLTNETEVEDTFRAAGFAIVHPQELTLAEQLAIYQGVDCLAGQYSSALHNALFARRGIKVLSLNRINWYQSMIARLRGQRLGFVPPADGVMRDWRRRGAAPVEYNIDCVELKAYIADFLRWQDSAQPQPPAPPCQGSSSDREFRSPGAPGTQSDTLGGSSSCLGSTSDNPPQAPPTNQTARPRYSIYDDDEAMQQRVAQGDHRGAVGGAWEPLGYLQANFLIAEGLRPEHLLIDVGCGSFRAGIKLIPYLNPSHYFGIDAHASLLEAGYAKEIEPAHLAARFPRANYAATSEFDVSGFGVRFDYGIAQSVFPHMPIDRLGDCLRALGPYFQPGGRFYATFFLVDEADFSRGVRHARGEIVTSPDRHPFHTTLSTIKRIAELAGVWDMRLIGDWNHPRSEQMVRFTRLQ